MSRPLLGTALAERMMAEIDREPGIADSWLQHATRSCVRWHGREPWGEARAMIRARGYRAVPHSVTRLAGDTGRRALRWWPPADELARRCRDAATPDETREALLTALLAPAAAS